MEQKNQNTIVLGDLIKAVIKNWILILITVISVIILGAIYTFGFTTEKYQSSTTLVVSVELYNSNQQDGQIDYTSSLRLVNTVGETVTQDVVLKPVAEQYKMDVKQLRQMINVKVSTTSFYVNITVEDSQKERVTELTNSIAWQLEETVKTNPEIAKLRVTVGQTTSASEASYSSPNKTLYLLVSAVAGVVIALCIVFVKEFLSNKFKNKDEIEYYTNKKIIGIFFDEKEREKERKLITDDPIVCESCNKLVTNIKYSDFDNPYRVIVTTSTIKGELKTTVSSALAYNIATNKEKVIVVDLDLRAPTIHKIYGVEKEIGIVDYIEGSANKDSIIKQSNGVSVITAGKTVANPIPFLKSSALQNLIQTLKDEFDYVILDTPPLLAFSDALIVSELADGILYNVAINSAKKKEVVECINNVTSSNKKIIGINVTKVNEKSKNSYYYYAKEYAKNDD